MCRSSEYLTGLDKRLSGVLTNFKGRTEESEPLRPIEGLMGVGGCLNGVAESRDLEKSEQWYFQTKLWSVSLFEFLVCGQAIGANMKGGRPKVDIPVSLKIPMPELDVARDYQLRKLRGEGVMESRAHGKMLVGGKRCGYGHSRLSWLWAGKARSGC